jgi:dinuclear metal center YbgI/SA1388 family protein
MKFEIILDALQSIAPLEYAESWDNVGLLVGRRTKSIERVLTCLTLSEQTLDEAIERRAQLVICHHPIPFKPMSRITSDHTTGSLLLKAIEHGVAIYAPHTAWDNAQNGINQQLAELLELTSIQPLQKFTHCNATEAGVGTGRCGYLNHENQSDKAKCISDVVQQISKTLELIQPRWTHQPDRPVRKVGIVCGSGGSMLGLVASRGCDLMLTGEATYHQCLEAESRGVAILMLGHHASEFFAMERLAIDLRAACSDLEVFASKKEVSRF